MIMQMKCWTSLMRNHEALSLGRSYPDSVTHNCIQKKADYMYKFEKQLRKHNQILSVPSEGESLEAVERRLSVAIEQEYRLAYLEGIQP